MCSQKFKFWIDSNVIFWANLYDNNKHTVLLLSYVKKMLCTYNKQSAVIYSFEQSSPFLFEASYYSFCISERYLTTLSKNDIFKLANLIGWFAY